MCNTYIYIEDVVQCSAVQCIAVIKNNLLNIDIYIKDVEYCEGLKII
jgi:hypothetical protein